MLKNTQANEAILLYETKSNNSSATSSPSKKSLAEFQDREVEYENVSASTKILEPRKNRGEVPGSPGSTGKDFCDRDEPEAVEFETSGFGPSAGLVLRKVGGVLCVQESSSLLLDQLLEVNGNDVKTKEDVDQIVKTLAEGEKITVKVRKRSNEVSKVISHDRVMSSLAGLQGYYPCLSCPQLRLIVGQLQQDSVCRMPLNSVYLQVRPLAELTDFARRLRHKTRERKKVEIGGVFKIHKVQLTF